MGTHVWIIMCVWRNDNTINLTQICKLFGRGLMRTHSNGNVTVKLHKILKCKFNSAAFWVYTRFNELIVHLPSQDIYYVRITLVCILNTTTHTRPHTISLQFTNSTWYVFTMTPHFQVNEPTRLTGHTSHTMPILLLFTPPYLRRRPKHKYSHSKREPRRSQWGEDWIIFCLGYVITYAPHLRGVIWWGANAWQRDDNHLHSW